MLKLNDTRNTHIDLTRKNLTSISYRGYLELQVEFKLAGNEVQTAFTYESVEKAKADFEMILDMISDDPTLLVE